MQEREVMLGPIVSLWSNGIVISVGVIKSKRHRIYAGRAGQGLIGDKSKNIRVKRVRGAKMGAQKIQSNTGNDVILHL